MRGCQSENQVEEADKRLWHKSFKLASIVIVEPTQALLLSAGSMQMEVLLAPLRTFYCDLCMTTIISRLRNEINGDCLNWKVNNSKRLAK